MYTSSKIETLSQSPKGQFVHPLKLSNPKGLNNRNWAGRV